MFFSKGGGSLKFSDEFIKREGSEVQIILGLGLGLGRGLGGLQLSWVGTDFQRYLASWSKLF